MNKPSSFSGSNTSLRLPLRIDIKINTKIVLLTFLNRYLFVIGIILLHPFQSQLTLFSDVFGQLFGKRLERYVPNGWESTGSCDSKVDDWPTTWAAKACFFSGWQLWKKKHQQTAVQWFFIDFQMGAAVPSFPLEVGHVFYAPNAMEEIPRWFQSYRFQVWLVYLATWIVDFYCTLVGEYTMYIYSICIYIYGSYVHGQTFSSTSFCFKEINWPEKPSTPGRGWSSSSFTSSYKMYQNVRSKIIRVGVTICYHKIDGPVGF